jgi:hypothetical protein
LEVKPSPNPFFQTTTGEIGARPDENIQWKVDGKQPPFQHGKHTVDGNFSFLYTRESDRIGGKVPKPVMKETRLLTKTEFLKKKREEFAATSDLPDELQEATRSPPKPTAAGVLAVYKHEPKYEDPRYTTSMVGFQTDAGARFTSFLTTVKFCRDAERIREEASFRGHYRRGPRCPPSGLLALF